MASDAYEISHHEEYSYGLDDLNMQADGLEAQRFSYKPVTQSWGDSGSHRRPSKRAPDCSLAFPLVNKCKLSPFVPLQADLPKVWKVETLMDIDAASFPKLKPSDPHSASKFTTTIPYGVICEIRGAIRTLLMIGNKGPVLEPWAAKSIASKGRSSNVCPSPTSSRLLHSFQLTTVGDFCTLPPSFTQASASTEAAPATLPARPPNNWRPYPPPAFAAGIPALPGIQPPNPGPPPMMHSGGALMQPMFEQRNINVPLPGRYPRGSFALTVARTLLDLRMAPTFFQTTSRPYLGRTFHEKRLYCTSARQRHARHTMSPNYEMASSSMLLPERSEVVYLQAPLELEPVSLVSNEDGAYVDEPWIAIAGEGHLCFASDAGL
ncbi:hypothetical protein BDR05DRAFT_953203 [Suillus weaverae]|nr:hypothetical protein BDR05DRAFT_953203 [Suillus weaverae]